MNACIEIMLKRYIHRWIHNETPTFNNIDTIAFVVFKLNRKTLTLIIDDTDLDLAVFLLFCFPISIFSCITFDDSKLLFLQPSRCVFVHLRHSLLFRRNRRLLIYKNEIAFFLFYWINIVTKVRFYNYFIRNWKITFYLKFIKFLIFFLLCLF